jgi:hypothetical protein
MTTLLITLAVMLAAIAMARDASPANKATAYWTAYFNGSCGPQPDCPFWDSYCQTWMGAMSTWGWQTAGYGGPDLSAEKFDSSYGKDNLAPTGVDSGQAALICTHGCKSSDGWRGTMHSKSTVSGTDCTADANSMALGPNSGGKLKFLHLSSCHSMRWSTMVTWRNKAAKGVHVVTGFHGIMYITPFRIAEYQNLANNGHSMSVALAWVWSMYHSWNFAEAMIGWGETCPVSMVLADNYTNAMNRMWGERYNAIDADRPTNTWYVLFPGGCAPKDDDPIPMGAGGSLFDVW